MNLSLSQGIQYFLMTNIYGLRNESLLYNYLWLITILLQADDFMLKVKHLESVVGLLVQLLQTGQGLKVTRQIGTLLL